MRNLLGRTYNLLTCLEYVGKNKHGKPIWKFQCSCGNTKNVVGSDVVNGHSKSCGCLTKRTTHGKHNTREYQIWADMKVRCTCKTNKAYSYYGGRGISYAPEWEKFENFWEDMKEGYSSNLTLDRIDNSLGYSKENCRWVSGSIQQHNQRQRRGSSRLFKGVELRPSGKFSVRIRDSGKNTYLGSFTSQLDAAKVYDDASEKLYGDRPNKTQ